MMKYLNVFTFGLRGRRHPALKIKSNQAGGSPRCRICQSGCDETICHVISSCQALSVERERLLIEFNQLCNKTKNQIMFIIDPTSLNLKSRINTSDPLVPMFYKLSCDLFYIIDKTRKGLLKEIEKNF